MLVSANEELFPHVVSLTKVVVPGPDEIFTYKIFNKEEKMHYKTNNTNFLRIISGRYKNIIGITIFNEDFSSLYQTLSGIFENKISSSSSN